MISAERLFDMIFFKWYSKTENHLCLSIKKDKKQVHNNIVLKQDRGKNQAMCKKCSYKNNLPPKSNPTPNFKKQREGNVVDTFSVIVKIPLQWMKCEVWNENHKTTLFVLIKKDGI